MLTFCYKHPPARGHGAVLVLLQLSPLGFHQHWHHCASTHGPQRAPRALFPPSSGKKEQRKSNEETQGNVVDPKITMLLQHRQHISLPFLPPWSCPQQPPQLAVPLDLTTSPNFLSLSVPRHSGEQDFVFLALAPSKFPVTDYQYSELLKISPQLQRKAKQAPSKKESILSHSRPRFFGFFKRDAPVQRQAGMGFVVHFCPGSEHRFGLERLEEQKNPRAGWQGLLQVERKQKICRNGGTICCECAPIPGRCPRGWIFQGLAWPRKGEHVSAAGV